MALTNKLEAIGNAIRQKTGSTDKMTLDDMATAIKGITTGEGGGLSGDDFVISGDCGYKFYGNGWNWYMEKYSDVITSKNITNATYMFTKNNAKSIDWDINLSTTQDVNCSAMFDNSTIQGLPKITGKPRCLDYLFNYAEVKEIREDFLDYMDLSYVKTNNMASIKGMFSRAYELQKVPESVISKLDGNQSYIYAFYKDACNYCYVLGGLRGIPITSYANITSNMFDGFVSNCYRIKEIVFNTNNGVPYVANWKNQTMDLSNIGYAITDINITGVNLGNMTDAVKITDEETYRLYKDNEKSYTLLKGYSRYNHDSAVETINSLPDTSAYLASKGGTNTIKFSAEEGSLTDGGAINTMTEEEIAVATAKGWTVTYV